MDKTELRLRLEASGIRADSYSLNGPSEEAYCLGSAGGRWEVYYFERGIETGKREFTSEAQACEHLLTVLCADQTTRRT